VATKLKVIEDVGDIVLAASLPARARYCEHSRTFAP